MIDKNEVPNDKHGETIHFQAQKYLLTTLLAEIIDNDFDSVNQVRGLINTKLDEIEEVM